MKPQSHKFFNDGSQKGSFLLHNTINTTSDTLNVVQSIAKHHGITRAADITEFSSVRLPVWIAFRPNAKCLSQSAGKGLCSDSARISALMEGIEVAVSENVDWSSAELATLEHAMEVRGADKGADSKNSNFVDPHEYPLQPCIPNGQKIPWLQCQCLRTGEPWKIPARMLSLDFTLVDQNLQRPREFRTTSNGLASGRTFEEACVSGLLEVIERHSVTTAATTSSQLQRIDVGQSSPPALASVLEELQRNDVNVEIYEVTCVDGLHAIEAFVWSLSGAVPPAHGFGCSLSFEVAILRAVLEANQASTILMSGSRDDLCKHAYLVTADFDKVSKAIASKARSTRIVHTHEFCEHSISPKEELRLIIESVSRYVDREILVYQYTPFDYPVSVCKVFVPTLEGYLTSGYRPQRRVCTFSSDLNMDNGLQLAAGGRM